MITKKDYAIGALVGFFAGIFAIPTLVNLGVKSAGLLIALPPIAAILIAFGVWLGKFLSRWIGFLTQFAKFAAVGFLSTAIDFGVLNVLSMLTGITEGFKIGGVNIPGFAVAVCNGYLWNQLWVFKARNEGEGLFHDFPKFLGVTIIGLLINSGIIILITTYVAPSFGAGKEQWLNLAKAGATAISLIWNFAGYKLVVFKKSTTV